ncbi:MAG: LLM class flavin-dependent oxidoreductase [Anaerolineae bacterium]
MKFGVTFPYIESKVTADLAAEAEAAGWDGIFVWDTIWGIDAWITLTAVALQTTRVTLGVLLTPLSRRKPWEVASQTATLDRLSGGRLVFPVGLGAPETGWANFGEETDRKIRAERMDEGLDILTGLWKGQPFNYTGKYYQIKETSFMPPPPPLQQPRIPVWVVGAWPSEKSMQRVIKYDGLLPMKMENGAASPHFTPDDIRAMRAYIEERRKLTTPFDIIVEGETPGDQPEQAAKQARQWADAGVTWWQEDVWAKVYETRGVEGIRQRLKQGPPRG